MGGGDWKDSGYRRLLGRTEDLSTSHTHKLQELAGFPLLSSMHLSSFKDRVQDRNRVTSSVPNRNSQNQLVLDKVWEINRFQTRID